MQKDSIPFFEDDVNPPLAGFPTVEREAIIAIIYDPKTETILALDWPKFSWHTFLIGGIEAGETPVQAALREIKEEVGYINVKLIQELCKTRSSYHAAHKKENRLSNETTLLFELQGHKQVEISSEEKAKHNIVWVPKGEITTWLTIIPQLYMAKKAMEALA